MKIEFEIHTNIKLKPFYKENQSITNMKHFFLVLLFFSTPFTSSFGQLTRDSLNSTITIDTLKTELSELSSIETRTFDDTIKIVKKFGEIKGFRNDELLTYANYKMLFANNPNALAKIRTSNFLHKTGKFFGFVGGYMFGFIGVLGLKNINSVDYTWGMALGASAAIIGVGYIFYFSGNKSQIKAIKIFNNSQRNFVDKEKVSIKIGFTNSGVGFVYNF